MTSESDMIKVHIADSTKCLAAVEWCKANIPNKVWSMDTHWPAQGYDFQFRDAQSATIFSLKWAGTA